MESILKKYGLENIKNGIEAIDIGEIVKALGKSLVTKDSVKIALIGQTGVGKTSTVNALFNTNLPVSHFGSCTQVDQHVKTRTKKGVTIEIIDMPGLWAGESETQRHWETYKRVIPTVDCAIWVISAGDRALEGMQTALKRIAEFSDCNIMERIVFGINKAEHMHPENWNNQVNLPSAKQSENLNSFCKTVKKAIRESFPKWDGTIVYYSAKKHFRLEELLEQMLIVASPDERIKMLKASEPRRYEDMVEDKRALNEALKMRRGGK